MANPRTSAFAATVAAVLALAAAGCGNDSGTSSSSTTSSASATSSTSATTSSASAAPSGAPGTPGAEPNVAYAPAGDYSGLLIKPTDIGPDVVAPNPPVQNPNGAGQTGIGQLFTSPDGSRKIADTITLFADPATASSVAASMNDAMSKDVPGAPAQKIDVGTNGQMFAGQSPDKANAVTELSFASGKAVVFFIFQSAPNDPISADAALDIARKQEAAVKAGLPS
jgi:hypothetical protein